MLLCRIERLLTCASWELMSLPGNVWRWDVLCRVGVTSEPECTVRELMPVDKFMILASDGVWEFIESQDAVDIVGNCETVEEGCRQVRKCCIHGHLVACMLSLASTIVNTHIDAAHSMHRGLQMCAGLLSLLLSHSLLVWTGI